MHNTHTNSLSIERVRPPLIFRVRLSNCEAYKNCTQRQQRCFRSIDFCTRRRHTSDRTFQATQRSIYLIVVVVERRFVVVVERPKNDMFMLRARPPFVLPARTHLHIYGTHVENALGIHSKAANAHCRKPLRRRERKKRKMEQHQSATAAAASGRPPPRRRKRNLMRCK